MERWLGRPLDERAGRRAAGSCRYLAAFGPATRRRRPGVVGRDPSRARSIERLRPELVDVPRRATAASCSTCPTRRDPTRTCPPRRASCPSTTTCCSVTPTGRGSSRPAARIPLPPGQRRRRWARSWSTACSPGRGGSPGRAAARRSTIEPFEALRAGRPRGARGRGRAPARVRRRRIRPRYRRGNIRRRRLPGCPSTTPTSAHRRREPATVRIAMWSARHRWPVAALWFVATIGLLAISLSMGGINASDANANPNEQQIEASKAYDVFNAGGTNDPFEQVIVVVGGAPGATADPAFKAAVGDLVAQLRASRRAARRRPDADLQPAGRPVHGAARGRPRLARRVDRPDRRADRRRQRPGSRRSSRRSCRSSTTARAANPDLRHPRHQQHVHQRRHQRAHLDGPRLDRCR